MHSHKINLSNQDHVNEVSSGTRRMKTLKWRLAGVFTLVFAVFNLTSPMVALSQDGTFSGSAPMTITGSTGSVDEADLTEYEMRSQFATIKDSVSSAQVTYRYNIVPVQGIATCISGPVINGTALNEQLAVEPTPCSYAIRIRYRDTGANQNVIVRLRAANTEMDGVTTIYEFNSDANDTFANPPPANVNANQTVDRCVTLPSPHLLHGNFVYFLEVVVSKEANDGTLSPGFIAFVMGANACGTVF